jgi:hypothetical protein
MSADPAPQTPAPDPAAVLAELRPALVRFFRRRRTAPGEAEDLAQDVIVSTLALGLARAGQGLRLPCGDQPLAGSPATPDLARHADRMERGIRARVG